MSFGRPHARTRADERRPRRTAVVKCGGAVLEAPSRIENKILTFGGLPSLPPIDRGRGVSTGTEASRSPVE